MLRPKATLSLIPGTMYLSRRLLQFLPWVGLAVVPGLHAQISLSTAVNLALQNSPRVKIAQVDLDRARAVLSESREYFVPSASATAGVGKGVGAPLSPPVIFSVGAQSLVFSFSQRDYIRAGHSGVTSAELALDVARTDVSEDTINTYLALDNAQRRGRAQAEALAIANRLSEIVGDRFAAGVDSHAELVRVKRTAAQIQLQQLQAEDEIASNQEHLAALTGLPATGWQTVPESIPELHLPDDPQAANLRDPNVATGMSAAFASAQARQYTARGDERALRHPQVSFSAQYSRLSDAFNTYDIYYPGFFQQLVNGEPTGARNSANSLSAGIQITLPLVDMVRRTRAREASDDAQRAFLDAQIQQTNFLESRVKLRHSVGELAARATIAGLDHDLAQDDLDAVRLRLQAASGSLAGPQSTPKDEQNALLAERQRTIDMLSAELSLQQTEVTLMRQEGSLSKYLAATLSGVSAMPSVPSATPDTRPVLPVTVGAAPGSTAPDSSAIPAGSSPAPVPTTGSIPSTLPSAPVTTPPAPAVTPHS